MCIRRRGGGACASRSIDILFHLPGADWDVLSARPNIAASNLEEEAQKGTGRKDQGFTFHEE